MFKLIINVIVLLTLIKESNWLNSASAAEIQHPANQAPASKLRNPSLSSSQQMDSAATIGSRTMNSPLPKLPKINIYLGRNEIKKLLGIDTRINYVSEGNINLYPLGFTIPLGYNQSDMIFTWQNLGQTNVNYSISLSISNDLAVNPPLINITRNGLIPKHEQVFKITLPCSGKVTNEIDVEVFINISGYVLDQDADGDEEADSKTITDDESRSQSNNNNGPLDPASSSSSSSSNSSAAVEDALKNLMQSDQASGQEPKLRQVSHLLAIKRKKICTVHPVAVQPNVVQPTQTQLVVQPPASSPVSSSTSTSPTNRNKWTQSEMMVTSQTNNNNNIKPNWSEQNVIATQQAGNSLEATRDSSMDSAPNGNRQISSSLAKPSVSPPFSSSPLPFGSSRRIQDSGFYPSWHPFHQVNSMATIAPGNPLNEILANRQQQQTGSSTPSPLVLVLALLSLLISVALILLVVLSSSRRFPFNKLSTLTSCILRKTPASRANKCKSPIGNAMINSLRIGTKSAASSMSGLSAISGNSHAAKSSTYCYKGNCTTISQYYGHLAHHQHSNSNGNNNNHHHHHHHHQQQPPHYQQHPPTADLLGTGYQCQPPPQYPIYHIATGSNAQTTRLIWNSGNGTNPDGFTIDGSYMPLSNQNSNLNQSDNGSAYQSVY